MAVVTIKDVLEHAERFEQMLADYYASVAEHSARQGVQMLADYMSRHRKRMHEILGKLTEHQAHHICSMPIKFESHAADCRCFEGIELSPGAEAGEVLDAAVTFDECLVRLYRQVLQMPLDQEIKELFESLVVAEQRDEVELKKIKAMDYF